MFSIRRFLIVALVLSGFGCEKHIDVMLEAPAGAISGVEIDGVQRFLGIPYAETTAGENRWRPPVPLEPWEELFEADDYGPWCPQFDNDRREEGHIFSGEGWTVFLDVPPNQDSSEDCLSLNIWAPKNADVLKPVMVFLHGNALGSSYPAYDGTAFAQDGIVMVSINFRLHTMGNFAHPAITKESDSTAPLVRYTELDQLAALRWVQKNISAFGGNPDDVTLVGSSNGGAGILQMLSTHDARGLFHKAVVQSGNGWWEPVSLAQNEKLGCMLASKAGLNGCDATASELREVPWYKFPITGPYGIDGRTWKLGATQAIANGTVLDIPLLIGWNDYDGSSLRYSPQHVIATTQQDVLATYSAEKYENDESLAHTIYTDLHSGAPARWVAHQLEGGAPTYLYLFSYVLSSERGDVPGAAHGYELPHVFDSWDELLPPILGSFLVNDEDRRMTDVMHACWVSFIKAGTPSCPNSPEWPRYQRSTDQLMQLDIPTKVISGYRAKHLDAHERALEYYLVLANKSIEALLDQGIGD